MRVRHRPKVFGTLGLVMSVLISGQVSEAAGRTGLVSYVRPLQGTDSSFDFSYGNTYPAVALPFPMNVWSPYTQRATCF